MSAGTRGQPRGHKPTVRTGRGADAPATPRRKPRARGWWRAPRLPTVAALLVVSAACLLVHARSVGFGFTHLDDDHLIVDRWERIREVSYIATGFREPYFPRLGPNEGYYRPLVTASLVLDAAGRERPDAAPFHRTNVVLHLVSCALLLLLLEQLGAAPMLALALTMLFAVHPAFTMVVEWIPGRNDLLLGVFLLGAWLAFGRGALPAWRLALHLALLFAALLTKEAAAALPVLLLAQRWLLDRRGPEPRRDAALWIGWALVLAAWWWMRTRVGTGGELISLAARAGYLRDRLPGLLIGLGKLILPLDLKPLANQADSSMLWGWLALVLLAAAWVAARGAERRLAVLGALVFLAFLVPTLAVSNTLLLENRLYLPAVGIALIAAAACARVPRLMVA
ncbi:MAG: hypothetical protein ACRDL7_06280, partial [Gaiellaceae bacterium]